MKSLDETYDVVVCGGGLAGFSAALSAARHGASTVLIQDRPVLGGNSSSEVRVTPHGAAAFHAYARETGIISEALVQDRAVNHAKIEENGWTNSVWDMILYDMAIRTPNLTLHLNTSVTGVEVAEGRISSVYAYTLGSEIQRSIAGSVFIDCTGDGTVGALAENGWRSGIESVREFGEPHAPDEGQPDTMGSSLHFKTVDAGQPSAFTPPSWAKKYDDPEFFSEGGRLIPTLQSGYWWIELSTPWDTLYENEKIRHELTSHVLGIWDYLKNRHPYWSDKATNLALDWIGQVPGKRESRRLDGQYLLTENDLVANASFPDEVAYGGWYVDLHTIGGLLEDVAEPVTTALLKNSKHTERQSKFVGPFGIPLRSLLAKNVENLLFAGRNISATHAALGAARVMGTTAVMGQAVGLAAALYHMHSDFQDRALKNVETIQQTLLRDGCFLPGSQNRDAQDLARSATTSASSTALVWGVGPNSPDMLGGIDHWRGHPVHPFSGKLERRLAQWIARGPGQPLDTIRLAMSNSTEHDVYVDAKLYEVEHIWDYRSSPGTSIRSEKLRVPPGGPHWVEWPVNLAPATSEAASGYVQVSIGPAEAVEWHVSTAVLPGQLACYEDTPGHLRRFGGGSTMSFEVRPPQAAYRETNVLSGVTRPYRSTNEWRSDPAQPLPQTLNLRWKEAVKISQVQLTFAGNLLREYHAYPPFYRDPRCVRDYAIEARIDGAWVELGRYEGNFQPRVVHDVETTTTDELRIVVYATNGDPAAAIYEVRVYESPVCVGWPARPR